MRLIDADELKEIRHKYIQGQIKFDGNEYDLIDKCPTVDAVPVVRGKWIQHMEPYIDWVKYRQECSACHESVPGVIGPSYCPNCGADMRESEVKE